MEPRFQGLNIANFHRVIARRAYLWLTSAYSHDSGVAGAEKEVKNFLGEDVYDKRSP